MSDPFQPLLEVDLGSGTIEEATVPDAAREDWLGGTGLGLYLLSRELRPGLQATDAGCPVFILTGPLTGTVVPSSSDCALTTLNPDLPHHVCQAHAHAFFGARLRQAGWDGIVIRGRAASPVYLMIDGASVELRPADDLWGEDTFETTRRLRGLVDGDPDEVSVACIGPAGENLVWGSSIRVDEFSGWNQGGAGSVWGAKNLKAIVVRGTGTAPVNDAERLEALAAKMNDEIADYGTRLPDWPFGRRWLADKPPKWRTADFEKAFGLTTIPLVGDLGLMHGKNFTDTAIGPRFGDRLGEELKKWRVETEASWNCDFGCHHRTVCTTGPMAGATYTGFGGEAMEEVGPNIGVEDPAIALMLCGLVDGYGMKASGAPHIIGMLMEAFNEGDIGLEETGGIDLGWGNHEGVMQLLECTVQRTGLGDLIARGLKATATGLGIEHRAVHMKWDGFQDYDQRAHPLFLFQSQVASSAGATSAMNNELAFAMGIEPEAGFHEALDPEDQSYIAKLTFWSGRRCMWENSLGTCHFVIKSVQYPTLVEAVTAATGVEYTVEKAYELGERIIVLMRLVQLSLGFSADEDFVISDRLLGKIPDGPAKGVGMTADELRQARDEYYGYAGFSTSTGAPLPAVIQRLGLQEFAGVLR